MLIFIGQSVTENVLGIFLPCAWALRSRVLTEQEMARVADYGDSLNIEPWVSYNAAEKAKELNDALLQQFRLRAVKTTP